MIRIFGIILAFIYPYILYTQICTGNLGENIFINGDFGSGSSTVLQSDPKIAPGYSYSTSVPPWDGSYVIANTTDWPTAYNTWIRIKDRSTNPNGYMMIVNASHNPGIFYEQSITDLCENTLYEFSADIINLVRIPIVSHTLPNVSFLLNDSVFYNTGGIAQNEEWNHVGFTFTSKIGQSNLRLTLRNNAPGGSGNDLAIDNISFRACGPKALILPEATTNICEDGNPIDLYATIDGRQFTNPAIQWQSSTDGFNWSNLGKDLVQKHTNLRSGYYYYRYLLAASESNLLNSKCRLVSNIKTIFVQPKVFVVQDTICHGNEYIIKNKKLTQSGIYTDTLSSSLGCDSIVILHLTVVPDLKIKLVREINNPSCTGYKDASIRIQSISSGYAPYTSTFNNIQIFNNTVSQLGFGNYPLKIIDRHGCMLTESISIADPSKFSVSIDSSRTLKLGQTIPLKSIGSERITSGQFYYNTENICNSFCDTKTYLPIKSGILIFQAKSEKGCNATDSAKITIDDNTVVFIPTIFTPNGDGTNDIFIPYSFDNVVREINLFQVYDRYGGLVYSAKNFNPGNLNFGWDGTCRSKQVVPGVYVFQLSFTLINDRKIHKQGDVLLMR